MADSAQLKRRKTARIRWTQPRMPYVATLIIFLADFLAWPSEKGNPAFWPNYVIGPLALTWPILLIAAIVWSSSRRVKHR